MTFFAIRGRFQLVNQTKRGLSGTEPDGDSIRFLPDNPALLKKLRRLKVPAAQDAPVNLRFEGIDALEIHYPSYKFHQPDDLAKGARDFLTDKIGLDPVDYKAPDGIKVKPPVEHDRAPGWILSRSLDVHGRPVSFVFCGKMKYADGADVRLDSRLTRMSLNYQLLQGGLAYPLYYDTLFSEIRDVLSSAAEDAKRNRRGIWACDRTTAGLDVPDAASLATEGYIYPKLFRRMTDYFRQGAVDLSGFKEWLAGLREPDQVVDLDNNSNFTHLDNLLDITDNRIRMLRNVDRIVFVSQK